MIESVEPRIADATRAELADQRSSLKLIASENYASPAVLLTMGSWLSDKYAEGTIGHRFYAGCQNIDTVESIAAEHARELFGAEYAYLQPHSGIDANLVAFWAILAHRVELPELAELGVKGINDLSEEQWETLRHKFGNQRALGMSLDAGGHLTHGFRPNISGKMFHQRSYGTDPTTQLVDYDQVRRTAQEFKPLILIAGYSAYPRRINFAKMREIADEVGRDLHGRHGPLRRPGGRQGVHRRRGSGAARAPGHLDHAQVPARSARRPGAGHRGVRTVGRPGLPDGARRPARSCDGGQGRRLGRGPDRVLPDLRPGRGRQRPRRSPTACCAAERSWSPAARTTTWS